MTDRSIRMRLSAQVSDFNTQINGAAQTAIAASDRIAQASGRVQAARRREADAAREVAAAERNLNQARQPGFASTEQLTAATRRLETARNSQRTAIAALAAAEQAHEQVANRASSAAGRLAQSAQENTEQWTRAGGALMAAGAAVTAVGVAALKTGIQYNQLQQQSRAALTTLLGTAEDANGQMDKLDAFARTSPFAKQVFITAQQQLLAFGMTAEKVVPTLDAIQQAVAAAGGSSETLSQITFVIAQIQAAGKITAVDLMQLGQRGIDAATLIGSQMGMTGAQVRESITKGALDAGTALDALTAGMQERFGGAAANVKMTFAGATDRIKAAWRDLASELAEPLVGKEGGGALVGLSNNLADVMRQFQGLPGPAKAAAVSIAGVIAVAALASGGFLVLTPRILATRAALATLGDEIPRTTRVMSALGKAAGVLTVVAGAWQGVNALGKGTRASDSLDETTRALMSMGDGLESLDDRFKASSGMPWMRDYTHGVVDGMDTIINYANTFGGKLDDALIPGGSLADKARDRFAEVGEALAGMVASGETAGAQDAFQKLSDKWVELGGNAEDLLGLMPAYTDALANSATVAATAQTKAEALAASMGYVGSMSEDTGKALQKWRDATDEGFASFVDMTDAYAAAVEKNKEHAQQQADAANAEAAAAKGSKKSAKESQKSWEDFYDGVTVSADQYIAQLKDQVKAQTDWQDNMLDLARKVNEGMTGSMREAGQAMLDSYAQMGPEGAAQVALLNSMSDKEFDQTVKLWGRRGGEALASFTSKFEQYQQPVLDIDATTDAAYAQMQAFMTAWNGKKVYVSVDALKYSASGGMPGGATGTTPPKTRAGGGSVFGPGTSTSDSIPALLSDGEHVLSAREVDGLGGHTQVERLRAWARGAVRRASGGAVYKGHSLSYWEDKRASSLDLVRMRQQIRDLQASLKETEKVKGRTQQKLRGLDRREAELELQQARRDLSDALYANKLNKSSKGTIAHRIKRAEKAAEKADDQAQAEKEKTARRSAERREAVQSGRRGETVDQVTSGLPGAYSVVDQVLEQSRNKDLSKKQRDSLAKAAKDAEPALRRLYKQAENLAGKLAVAKDKVDELAQTKAQASSALAGGFSIGASATTQTMRTDAKGNVWYDQTGGGYTAGGMLGDAKSYAAKTKAFADKLSKVQAKLGPSSGVILQQLVGLGVDEGSKAADAILSMSSAQATQYVNAFGDIQTYADQAGEVVTRGFYKGGLTAAQGVYDGLVADNDKITAQLEKWGVTLQNALLAPFNLVIDAKGNVVPKPKKKARGGWVTGAGTTTSDSIHTLLSDQEFVVNARAASRNGPLLERINAGQVPFPAPQSPTVNVNVDQGAFAQALAGTSLWLLVDGRPVRAIIQAELTATSSRARYAQGR